jgi:hypothetical protein
MQLVIAAAVTKYETRTVSEEQMAEVRRAKAEWDGTRRDRSLPTSRIRPLRPVCAVHEIRPIVLDLANNG